MGIEEANAALRESWELDLRSPVDGSKPKRPRTIKLYLEELDRFLRWLGDAGRAADLESVQRADAVAWIADMRARGLSASTIRSRWIALRSFYSWAHTEAVVAENPVATVIVPRADEPAPDVLDDAVITALLKSCAGTAFNDRRDLALIRFMLATGLRVSEVCAITVPDIDLMTRLVAVTDGKGGKSRVARFDPATAAALDRYKRARGRHRLAGRPELWLGHRGPLTRKGVPTILEKRAKMAGVGHVHPHQTRHTFAHKMKRAGASSEDLMKLAGWADQASLRRYGSHLATERALAAYDNLDVMGDL